MQVLDWSIVGIFVVSILIVAYFCNKLNKSVSDFLAASRSAGRYLLTVATGAVAMAAIGIAAGFERGYKTGSFVVRRTLNTMVGFVSTCQ